MDKQKISGRAEELKGDLKQTAGDALGDKDMKTDGTKDKVEGKTDQAIGGAKDIARDVTR